MPDLAGLNTRDVSLQWGREKGKTPSQRRGVLLSSPAALWPGLGHHLGAPALQPALRQPRDVCAQGRGMFVFPY